MLRRPSHRRVSLNSLIYYLVAVAKPRGIKAVGLFGMNPSRIYPWCEMMMTSISVHHLAFHIKVDHKLRNYRLINT